MENNRSLLYVENISFKYNEETDYAIRNLSFSLKSGEWLAIVGHNGSGKSTLAKILNGILIPESGKVLINDTLLFEDTIWDVRKHIGMVFQNPDNQFVGTTVMDDVAFGLENNGIPREEMITRIDRAIKQVKMEDFLNYEPHQLSGGQKQRVAIASIIAVQPDIIVLDEATSMLDPHGRDAVLQTISSLKKSNNHAVISITHDLEEVTKADRVIVMKKGEIFAEGSPDQIFALGDELTAIGLDLPFPVKLSKMLANRGIPLSKEHLTQEGLVEELWTLRLKS